MLGGIDPVLIFQLKKLASFGGGILTRIPVISQIPTAIDMPPIPIYLSRELTGLYIDSESKNVDIETSTQTMTDGSTPDVDQKGLANVVSVNLFAKKDSIGLTLLSSLIDVLFDRVTSKEYSLSYLNGPITVFGGVLHSYSADQNAGDDLLRIKLEISKGNKNPVAKLLPPGVPADPGALPLIF